MKSFVLSLAAALSMSMLPMFAAAASPFSATVSFSPNPPKQGAETIIVRLSDASHRPVNGATVSISTAMPTMSMTGPTLQAAAKGNGRYEATTKLNFATRWVFIIVAKSNGNTVTRTITQNIK